MYVSIIFITRVPVRLPNVCVRELYELVLCACGFAGLKEAKVTRTESN